MKQFYFNTINKYFNTSYNEESFTLIEALKLVSKINETEQLLSMQDLNSNGLNDGSSNFKITLYRRKDFLECPFGQTSQKNNHIGNKLEDCLLFSISEWCMYHKYFDDFELYWLKRSNNSENIKYEGHIQIKGEVINIAKIYDEDYFFLEHSNVKGEIVKQKMSDNLLSGDIKQIAEFFAIKNIIDINENPDIFNLNKIKQIQLT